MTPNGTNPGFTQEQLEALERHNLSFKQALNSVCTQHNICLACTYTIAPPGFQQPQGGFCGTVQTFMVNGAVQDHPHTAAIQMTALQHAVCRFQTLAGLLEGAIEHWLNLWIARSHPWATDFKQHRAKVEQPPQPVEPSEDLKGDPIAGVPKLKYDN
jgi:hypothetical protein